MKYWNRLHTLDKDRTLYKVYEELINLDLKGFYTWVTKARTICNFINSINEDAASIRTQDRQIISSRLIHKYAKDYETEWLNCINNSAENSKLRTYKLFKTDLKREKYLSCLNNRSHIKAIAQFRTSSHNLQIELGRHTIPVTLSSNRICKFCSTAQIDDEIHMLIECPFHTQERNKFFNVIKDEIFIGNANNLEKFIIIMTSHSQSILNALGKYLHTGFCKREEHSKTTHSNTSD